MVGKASSSQDLVLFEQGHFETLRAGGKAARELGAEDHVDLVDVRQVDQGVESMNVDLGTGLFPGFAGRRLHGGLGVLHEARRQGPEALAGEMARRQSRMREPLTGSVPATMRGFW